MSSHYIAIAACICLLTICYSSKLTTLEVENANEDIEGNWDFNVKELTVLNNLIDKRVNKENKIGERCIFLLLFFLMQHDCVRGKGQGSSRKERNQETSFAGRAEDAFQANSYKENS